MTIDLTQARDLLKRAVETQGRDFIYNPSGNGMCRYTPIPKDDGPQGQTGCLVGVAMALAGVDVTRGPWRADLGLNIYSVCLELPGLLTTEAERYLSVAQQSQDHGSTWGAAYDRAECVYRAGRL